MLHMLIYPWIMYCFKTLFAHLRNAIPRFEFTRYHTERIISKLYILGFLPPVLLSENPTEVSSSSLEDKIFDICSLIVACLTSKRISICFCVNQTISCYGLIWTSIFTSPSVNKTNSFFISILLQKLSLRRLVLLSFGTPFQPPYIPSVSVSAAFLSCGKARRYPPWWYGEQSPQFPSGNNPS